MAGYVPESMKEVQAIIARVYAGTVMDAFTLAPELLNVAPVGPKADIDEQISMLNELEKKTREDRADFMTLCDVASVHGDLILRYARKNCLDESDFAWLEDRAKSFQKESEILEERIKAGLNNGVFVSQQKNVQAVARGLFSLLNDIKENGITRYMVMLKNSLSEGNLSFGGKQWVFPKGSPVKEFLMLAADTALFPDPVAVSNLERAQFEILQVKDVASFGYQILRSLGEKFKELKKGGLDSPKVDVLMSRSYKKMAERAFDAGKKPRIMHEPVVLSGPPGVGKTAILKEIASWTKTTMFAFSMAQMDAASFGFPVYDSVTGSAKRDVLDDMKNTVKKPGVVLLDEMNRTNTDIQGKLLTYLLDHKISGYTVHPLSLVLGAENPITTDPYGTMVKSIAMIDRCTYIDISNYEMIADGWFEWLENTYGEAMVENETLRMFINFLKENPPIGARDVILKISADPEANPNFPTPRSLDKAILDIAKTNADIDSALKRIRSIVGDEIANKFLAYIEIARSLPRIDEIIDRVDDIDNVTAALAMDSIVRVEKNGVTVLGFEPGALYAINGYDDGKRDIVPLKEEYEGSNSKFPKDWETLTPDIAKSKIEKIMNDLWFSKKNFFAIGAAKMLSDVIVSAFRSSIRDSLDKDEPFDSVRLNNILKAVCMFPDSTIKNSVIQELENFIFSFEDDNERKILELKIKNRKGVIEGSRPDEGIIKKALRMAPILLFLQKISRRYHDAGLNMSELLEKMKKERADDDRDI